MAPIAASDLNWIQVEARAALPPTTLPLIAPCNTGTFQVSALDLMLDLGLATCLSLDALLSGGAMWPVLRYGWIFDLGSPVHQLLGRSSVLRYHHATALSEALGIAATVNVAMREFGAAMTQPFIVDADLIRWMGQLPDGRTPISITGRWPDYFIVDLTPGGADVIAVECKGATPIARSQWRPKLVKATTQVASITVAGKQLEGIACCTCVDPAGTPTEVFSGTAPARSLETRGIRISWPMTQPETPVETAPQSDGLSAIRATSAALGGAWDEALDEIGWSRSDANETMRPADGALRSREVISAGDMAGEAFVGQSMKASGGRFFIGVAESLFEARSSKSATVKTLGDISDRWGDTNRDSGNRPHRYESTAQGKWSIVPSGFAAAFFPDAE